jgi:hypothetical protein
VHARRRNVRWGSGAATVAGGDRDRAERDARIEQAGTAGALAVERRAPPQAAVDASTGDVAAASSSRIEPDYGSVGNPP